MIPFLQPEATAPPGCMTYELAGILVHKGGSASQGHYGALTSSWPFVLFMVDSPEVAGADPAASVCKCLCPWRLRARPERLPEVHSN